MGLDYKKLYEEALKRAKAVFNVAANQGETQAAIEVIFPVLAESEDERMMREIIQYIREQGKKPTGLPNGSVAVADMLAWLEKQKEPETASASTIPSQWEEKQKEQKPAECLKAERDGWYMCIKDYYRGGKKQCSIGDLVQAKGGMYMMAEEDISEWFRKAYYEEVRNAFEPNTDTSIPEKPAEWSEDDEKTISDACCWIAEYAGYLMDKNYGKASMLMGLTDKLKSLRPQPKQEWSEEDEEMIQDIIASIDTNIAASDFHEMEDWLKSLRPQPHWKPSEEQMEALESAVKLYKDTHFEIHHKKIVSLYEQLKKLMEE